jgi:hypothetical protein
MLHLLILICSLAQTPVKSDCNVMNAVRAEQSSDVTVSASYCMFMGMSGESGNVTLGSRKIVWDPKTEYAVVKCVRSGHK